MNKIRKGDEVIVTTGKDKGKRGAVLTVQTDGKLLVEGVNIAKKHAKPNPMKGEQGGIVEKTMPIHVSNVALYDSKAGKASRVGIQIRDGQRIRVLKASGVELKG
jgi:large subunit ribosomal protein L24